MTHIDQTALLRSQKNALKKALPADHFYHALLNPLLVRLDYIRIQPKRILNIGWHANTIHAALLQRYSSADIILAHDIHSLSQYSHASFDLIIAHFPLVSHINAFEVLRFFHALLCEEGLLLFVDLGLDTLLELRQCFATVDQYPHIHTFVDMHDVGDWLRELHFSDPVVDREEMILAYDDVNDLCRDLKELGATNCHLNRRRGLLSRHQWQKMVLQYTQFKIDYFPATVEIMYGHGWKVKQDMDELNNEITIPVSAIRKK